MRLLFTRAARANYDHPGQRTRNEGRDRSPRRKSKPESLVGINTRIRAKCLRAKNRNRKCSTPFSGTAMRARGNGASRFGIVTVRGVL